MLHMQRLVKPSYARGQTALNSDSVMLQVTLLPLGELCVTFCIEVSRHPTVTTIVENWQPALVGFSWTKYNESVSRLLPVSSCQQC